jgi:hypothetical protein
VTGRTEALVFFIAALATTSASADHGALSLDLSVGGAGLSLPAPYAVSGPSTFAVDFEAMLGLRYAVTNELEFTLAGSYEPRLSYSLQNEMVTIPPSTGPTAGTVAFALGQYGVVAGVRYVRGSVWKLVLGLEGGWNHRSYSGVHFTFDGGEQALPSFGTDNIVIQPLLGVECAFADHWSLSLLSRFTALIGPDATVGASLMLSISYSWFL